MITWDELAELIAAECRRDLEIESLNWLASQGVNND